MSLSCWKLGQLQVYGQTQLASVSSAAKSLRFVEIGQSTRQLSISNQKPLSHTACHRFVNWCCVPNVNI